MDNINVGSDVLLAIGRLEGRMEQFLKHQQRHEERFDAIDTRLSSLEAAGSRSTGTWSIVRAVLTTAGAALAGFFANHFSFGVR
jgi:hypothetical protein